MKNNLFSNIKSDLPAGLVVFLVALPLCLGIALASGAPLFSGLISGIIGGIVVGALSGSHISVSGPAAGLTVIILTAIDSLGSFQALLAAVVIAGIIQLILGLLKAGIVSHFFPSSVIKGMLAAIGIILILKQIPHAVGYDADFEGDFSFFQFDGENTFSELTKALERLEMGAVLISTICLAIFILWEQPFTRKYSFFKIVPGGLATVAAGLIINQALINTGSDLAITREHLVNLPVATDFDEFLGLFILPDWTILSNSKLYLVAVTIAIVASLETLLCIEATDKLDPYKRITSTNRELKAQGIGNIAAGLIGGLPMTSVIVRSSANLDSGAKTKLSAIIHGILLFVTVIFIPNILNMIPLAALAAILLVVGYKLARISLFKNMYSLGWDQFLPFLITVVAILFTDLLRGIGIGMAISIFFILRNNYRSSFKFDSASKESGDGKTINIALAEEMTFLNKGSMLVTLREIPENSHVVIDGTKSKIIDHDVKEVIQNFQETAKHKNINVELKGSETWKKHIINL
ncbi:SulP family inorganic anion transporter [Fulvivirga sediminis]|uniref:SulP family inorganic anion transporter n=1 Tax=Fulvivirga sediminis TaxID=2803949 RepID=A0A937K2M7_9BACT|nr:SulP family inorganic anion transporter [Fulvivirga sediminis]MBL3658540.1 SulP family inorganic anion transporter [Fulvivirga sediminis]